MGKENTLLQSGQLLETIKNVTTIGVFQLDINSNVIYWNDNLKEIHEVPTNFSPKKEDLYGNCVNTHQKDQLTKAHLKAINEGVPFELEYEIVTKKGNTRLLRTCVLPIQKNGHCISIHGVTIEITCTKDLQTDILHDLQQLNEAEKLAKSGSWNWNVITSELKWSDNFYNIFQHDKDDPISYEVYLSYIHEDDKEKIAAKFEHALKTKQFPESTYRLRLKDGTIKVLKSIGEVISKKTGEVIKMVGTCQDITENVAREKELLENKDQLELAENINEAGSWQLSLLKDEFKWTDSLYKIFELKVGSKMSFNNLYEFIHPDDIEYVKEKFNEILEDKKAHEFVHRIILKNGKVKKLQVTSDPVTDTIGNVLELIGTIKDITKKSDREIELSNTHQQLLLTEQMSAAGTWQWNSITGMFKWSNNLYEIMDFEYGIPMNFEVLYKRIHPEDKHIVDNAMQLVQDTNTKQTFVSRIVLNDGSIKTLEITADVVSNEINTERELIGTARDITNNVHVKQELIEKKQLLDFAQELNTMGFFKWNTVTDKVTWSDSLYQIFEQPKSMKLNFDSYFSKVHPEDQNFIMEKIAISIKNKRFHNFNHRVLWSDGSIRSIKILGKITKNDTNQIEFLGISIDITESINLEEELSLKNQQLNLAEKIAKIGYWQWNTLTNEVFWSDNLHTIYGHDQKDPLTFETYIDYIHKNDKGKVLANFKNAMKSGIFHDSIYKIYFNDGSTKTIKSLGKVIRNKKGEVLEMIGTCQDITETIKKEQELIDKNQQLNFAEKIAEIGSWQWNIITGEINWSDNHYRLYGIEIGTPLNLETIYLYIHPENIDYLKKLEKQTLIDKIFKKVQYRIILDNGDIKTLEVIAEVITDELGKVIGLKGTSQDITNRIKTEQEIKEKNHLLSVSEKMAMMGSWKWNPTTGISKWSDNLYQIYGLELYRSISFELFMSKVHPNDIEKVNHEIKNMLETRISDKTLSYRIIKDNGDIRSLELLSEVIEDEKGNILELVGTMQDVTEKIKTKEKIKEKNQLLSFAEEMSMMGSWHWHLKSGVLKWSDNLYKIYGLTTNSPIDINIFYSRVHPDDLENVKTRILKLVEGNENIKSLYFRIILDDGSIRSMEPRFEITKDKHGKVIEIVGTAQDITERLQIEKDIQEKNHMLTFAEELAMIGYWQLNVSNGTFIWSDNMFRIFGFELGTPMNFDLFLSRMHPDDRDLLIKNKEKAILTKEFEKFTQRIVHNNGQQRFSEIVGKVITDEHGKVTEIIGSSRDITEEILSQQKLLKTNKNLEESTIILTSKNKQLAEFNHITSHNLRSPVSNLNALLNLHKKATSENKKNEIFEKFEIVIERLTETLNALIETITVKHNAGEVRHKLSLEQTLLKTKEILTAELMETGAVIKFDFNKAENVKYNAIYLESIFLNLVSNSLKYKSPDRVPEIFISSETINGRILIEFKDNGLGIDMKSHGHKIFGLNKVFHKHPEARGLGLFLTKAQIVAMGGSISVESEVNIGTTFYITLN